MENRKRNVQIIVRVTEEERVLIEEKSSRYQRSISPLTLKKCSLIGTSSHLIYRKSKNIRRSFRKSVWTLIKLQSVSTKQGGFTPTIWTRWNVSWKKSGGWNGGCFCNSGAWQNEGLGHFPTSKMLRRQTDILRGCKKVRKEKSLKSGNFSDFLV